MSLVVSKTYIFTDCTTGWVLRCWWGKSVWQDRRVKCTACAVSAGRCAWRRCPGGTGGPGPRRLSHANQGHVLSSWTGRWGTCCCWSVILAILPLLLTQKTKNMTQNIQLWVWLSTSHHTSTLMLIITGILTHLCTSQVPSWHHLIQKHSPTSAPAKWQACTIIA